MNWLLMLILLLSFILRFWNIGLVPPLIHVPDITGRIVSASLNLITIVVFYKLVKDNFRNTKFSLLSSFIFASSPWVLEQARIVSPVNNALCAILLLIYLYQLSGRSILRYLPVIFLTPAILLVYPKLWLFSFWRFHLNSADILNNIFHLTSAEFLFFKNVTFWWGGVKNYGVMLLSLLPFFYIGVYKSVIGKNIKLIIILGIILIVSSMSPFFPESREFFFSTPILSIMIAYGIISFTRHKKTVVRVSLIILLTIFVYDLGQYIHYYHIHYPQQVSGNIQKIDEPY